MFKSASAALVIVEEESYNECPNGDNIEVKVPNL